MTRTTSLAVLMLLVEIAVAASPMNLEAAAKLVQKKIEGRVLGGKTVKKEDRDVHVIRVLTPDGRVRHIRVEAQSGKILKERPEGH